MSYSHRNQVGIQFQLGTGYRAIAPYREEFCGQRKSNGENRAFCTGRSPAFLDVGLSYGVTSSLELLVEFRIGLESDFTPIGSAADAPRPLMLAPGLKLYIDDAGSTKFFSTLQVAFDFTDYTASGAEDGTDVGVRNVNGLLIDLHRTFGVYAHAGLTIGFVRWLRFEVEGGLGMQARFP